jgi:phospholipid/cholesterol/gamma-HCH transport system substrate-binding protein
MQDDSRYGGLRARWWTAIFAALIVAIIVLVTTLFTGSARTYVPITLTSDRAGLVMESGGKVKLRGVEVGRVSQINPGPNKVSLKLEMFPDQLRFIPANVDAQIKATTAFGSKYVDLIYPDHPSTQRLAAGAVLKSQNVSTEVNTVFENLVSLLRKIDPSKLNAILSAFAEGVRGQGERIGEATTAANEVLTALNQRNDTIRQDWRSLKGFSDAYSGAAQNIVGILDAASTTSKTITENASALDALLLNTIGLSNSGIAVLAPNQANLVEAINVLRPTTDLLMKYNPELTCTILGAKWFLDNGGYSQIGGNGRTVVLDAGLLPGDDPYKYPDNLPIVGARGGPGGKPSCGSLPDATKNFPVRMLITDTGYGTGMDWRPNPGIGFPGWADWLPTTRAVPEPPSVRYPGGPAPGPIPYPGAPPYGAPLYAPDGTPLYPGLPSAPPPGAPKEPGPRPGTEPFVVANPAQMQPTPTPPLPEQAAPSP